MEAGVGAVEAVRRPTKGRPMKGRETSTQSGPCWMITGERVKCVSSISAVRPGGQEGLAEGVDSGSEERGSGLDGGCVVGGGGCVGHSSGGVYVVV